MADSKPDAMNSSSEALRKEIFDLVARYWRAAHADKTFVPGTSPVPVSGRVYGFEEMQALVESGLDFWLTTGRFNDAFENRLAEYFGLPHVLTVNSGSSANLVALASLTSPWFKEDALKPGDEIITCATGFPTTVSPSLLYGLTPVFVDVHIPTYNIAPNAIEAAVSERTRAIMIAHTLGNPFDLGAVMKIAEKHDLWVIEDCCDALGATYNGKLVGTFGDIGTLSFYPAHHITMGEGGAVFMRRGKIRRAAESMRDWGRDCYCAPGKDNTCGKRFEWKLGDLPEGYDHKYIYTHAGFNLKITDMQAAVGLAQLDRLTDFIASRRRNFDRLRQSLADLEEFFILPEATPGSEPSWFGFPLTVRENVAFERDQLLVFLNKRLIGTRLLFGGNLVRQPFMTGRTYRISGTLDNSDVVMRRAFWLGVYPGLSSSAIDYISDCMHEFCSKRHRP